MNDPKTQYLYKFEAEVNRLLGDQQVTFFTRNPSYVQAMWTIAHFSYGENKTAAQGAKDWFDECVAPRMEKNARPTRVPDVKIPSPGNRRLKLNYGVIVDNGEHISIRDYAYQWISGGCLMHQWCSGSRGVDQEVVDYCGRLLTEADDQNDINCLTKLYLYLVDNFGVPAEPYIPDQWK